MSGNPCKGCFNSVTWDKSIATKSLDPIEVAKKINEISYDNKYVTIGGGEPTDQIDNVYKLCKELKKYGFHILMYTWKDIDFVLNSKISEVIDIAVTGEYIESKRTYRREKGDGFLNSIGSANQDILDVKYTRINKEIRSFKVGELSGIELDKDNNLIYKLK